MKMLQEEEQQEVIESQRLQSITNIEEMFNMQIKELESFIAEAKKQKELYLNKAQEMPDLLTDNRKDEEFYQCTCEYKDDAALERVYELLSLDQYLDYLRAEAENT